MLADPPPSIWAKIGEELWHNLDIAILGPVAAYLGTLAKGWIEKMDARSGQTNLCEEADRLIKFHATLAAATVASPNVQSAQAAVVCQLNRVLEQLSRSLTEPVGSRNSQSSLRSNLIVKLENGLLLYRPLGIWSALLHAVFYLMVPLWCFIVYVDFQPEMRDLGVATRIAMPTICAIPMVLCNYLARKVDAWTRRKRT